MHSLQNKNQNTKLEKDPLNSNTIQYNTKLPRSIIEEYE